MMYDFAKSQAVRGYQPAYTTGVHCPGCGHGHWHIGRVSAQCANCGTALPLAPVAGQPANPSYPDWAERV